MLHLGNSHLFHSLICGPFCTGSSTSQIQYSSSTAVPVPVPVLQYPTSRYCSILLVGTTVQMQLQYTSQYVVYWYQQDPLYYSSIVVQQYSSTVLKYSCTHEYSQYSISVLPTAAVQLLLQVVLQVVPGTVGTQVVLLHVPGTSTSQYVLVLYIVPVYYYQYQQVPPQGRAIRRWSCVRRDLALLVPFLPCFLLSSDPLFLATRVHPTYSFFAKWFNLR